MLIRLFLEKEKKNEKKTDGDLTLGSYNGAG